MVYPTTTSNLQKNHDQSLLQPSLVKEAIMPVTGPKAIPVPTCNTNSFYSENNDHSQTGVDRLIEFITKAAITETKVCNQNDQLKSALSECGQTTLQRGWKQNTEKHRTDQQLLQCDANVKGVSRLGLQPKEKVYVSLPKHTYQRVKICRYFTVY